MKLNRRGPREGAVRSSVADQWQSHFSLCIGHLLIEMPAQQLMLLSIKKSVCYLRIILQKWVKEALHSIRNQYDKS